MISHLFTWGGGGLGFTFASFAAIFPESDVARDLPKADMAKRTKAYAEKKAKLANPNFYVSKTRLCVRNLPTAVDEGKLKGLCQHVANGPTSSVVQVGG